MILYEYCSVCGKKGYRESFHGEGEWYLREFCIAHHPWAKLLEKLDK